MRHIAQTSLSATLAALLLLAAPMAAHAQDSTAAETEQPADPAEDLGLSLGEAVDEDGNRLGEEYIQEAAGDWTIVCIRTTLTDDPCSLRQLLRDGEGNSISTVDIVSFPPGNQVVAAGRIVTPLETLLTQQATLSVDGGAGRRYPFEFCTDQGCISRVGFAEADINAFRRGAEATLTIVPALAPDQKVRATMSLAGFTAGFKRLQELNQANAAAVAAARAANGN